MGLNRGRALKVSAVALAGTLLLGGGVVAYGQTTTPTPGAGPPFGPFGTHATCPATGAPMGAMMGAMGYGGFGGMWGASDAVLGKLGMTADQLLAERRSGKSLAQIAQEKGVDKATLVSTILAEHKASLDAQVKAGTLTQAQTDAMQSIMQQRIAQAVDQTAVGPPGWPGAGAGMVGRGMGPGMMGMMGCGFSPR